ncbi:hypothetical protein [Streptomyces sp. NPDC056061]|uniref:hypothetical protein n=1 Tax=Streptomyces sp. NPDC056061 TaxID=3345700 RepID=UPI0035D59653
MNVDTAFLDGYRRSGGEGMKRARVRDMTQRDMDPEIEPPPPDPDAEPDSGEAAGLEPGPGDITHSGGSPQRGGSGAVGSGGTSPSSSPGAASDAAPPGSLRLTGQQDAMQNGTGAAKGSARGTGTGGGAGADLPHSGFRLGGVRSQPHIKSLPEAIIGVLREQLRAAAVRELGASDRAAREFSERLSQGTLVMAFLLAQLDLRLDVDPATGRAMELYRSRDPLLGSMAARLDGLEKLQAEKRELLSVLRNELSEVRQTSAVIEQAIAYAIADRTENFLRGSHNTHDAPITHKDAVFVRDRARELTRKQHRLEQERDGRPIR